MAERDGRFCLVVNPAAGRGRSLRVLPEVTAVLDAAGASYEVSGASPATRSSWPMRRTSAPG